MGAKRLGGKRPGGKRLGGETTRGGNGLGAKRPGFFTTEIAAKKRKCVDILEQSLSQTCLCAIFKFVDWFAIN